MVLERSYFHVHNNVMLLKVGAARSSMISCSQLHNCAFANVDAPTQRRRVICRAYGLGDPPRRRVRGGQCKNNVPPNHRGLRHSTYNTLHGNGPPPSKETGTRPRQEAVASIRKLLLRAENGRLWQLSKEGSHRDVPAGPDSIVVKHSSNMLGPL